MTNEAFISGYLDRIDYHGSTAPCAETLCALHRAHISHVPFENLELLGEHFEPNLDRNFLFDRIVTRRHGGVCYELNTAFYSLLTAMGFDAYQISGSVQPGENLFSHVATLVCFPEGRWLVDVGFGDAYLPPVQIRPEPTTVDGIDYYLSFTDDTTAEVMRRRPGQPEERMYTMVMTPRAMSDYFERFRWASAKGNTIFSQRHICVLHTEKAHITLRRGVLTVEQNGQLTENRPIAPGTETECCLRDYFGLI